MERPSETCRVSFQNKFGTLVHLVSFSIETITKETGIGVSLQAFEESEHEGHVR